MKEIFIEIFVAMKFNKMRVMLTGFSIGWGIFLLIVMLGAGNGLLHGITNGFITNKENIIKIVPATTSIPYKGLQKGREIFFTDNDCGKIQKDLSRNIKMMVPQLDTLALISSGAEHCTASINGFYPGYLIVKNQRILEGRDLNDTDIKNSRKVCVLTSSTADVLFPKGDAVGKIIKVFDVVFTVVGVTKSMQAADISKAVYAPFSTVRQLYFRNDNVNCINIILKDLNTLEANDSFVETLRNWFAENKDISPKDYGAINLTDDFDMFIQISGIMNSIQSFVWIVGLATLIAGVVGVSNIMLITVKERVREIGVRKAMGASSGSVIRLVLLEAVIITLLFGYLGMLVGIGLTQLADFGATSALGADNAVFTNPTVDFNTIIIANCVLLICGIIAGYIPAKKAAKNKLVDSLAGII